MAGLTDDRDWALFVFEKNIDPQLIEKFDENDKYVFEVLPFIAIASSYPVDNIKGTYCQYKSYPPAKLRIIAGIDKCLERKTDIINISLGPPSEPYNPDDPLQIAVKVAYEQNTPVVVAAGNGGPDMGTLQSLALSPWAIAAGATDRDECLLDCSSRGSLDGPFPCVVSDGNITRAYTVFSWWLVDGVLDPEENIPPSTSFAAPRVSSIAAWLKACFGIIVSELSDQQSGRWGGPLRVKYPEVGFLDTGADPKRIRKRSTEDDYLNLIPNERQREWFEVLTDTLVKTGAGCRVSASPNKIREVLEIIAKPLPYARYEAGAGFVSYVEAANFLGSFTPSRFVRLFCTRPGRLHKKDLDSLDRQLGPLWEYEDVNELVKLAMNEYVSVVKVY